MKKILPMRFRMLHFFSNVNEASVNEVMKALDREYGKEKYFKFNAIDEDLISMKENGLIDINRLEMKSDKLITYYKINEGGKNLLKNYLPKEWRLENAK